MKRGGIDHNYDELTRTPVFMDYTHGLVHDGRVFGFHVEDIDLDAIETHNIVFTTGAKRVHVTLTLEGIGGDIPTTIWRGPTVTAATGTAVPSDNYNDDSSNVALVSILDAPTITADGTKIATRRLIGNTTGNSKVGTSIHEGLERVWRANTKYMIRFAGSVDNSRVTLDGVFYEEL